MSILRPRRSGVALRLMASLCFASFMQPIYAQSPTVARALFQQKGCAQCHYVEARGVAPSVKSMRTALAGDYARTIKGIKGPADHADSLKSLSAADIQSMAEWLSGVSASSAPQKTPPKTAAAPASPPAPSPAQVAKAAADAEAARRATEERQARREATARLKQEQEEQRKRDAAEALAAKKREAERLGEERAKAEQALAEAKRNQNAQREAELRRELDARREAEERQQRELAESRAKAAEAEAAAKREAEARAKREAELAAAQKREAEAQAAKKAEAAKAVEAAKPAENAAKQSDAGDKKKLGYRDGSDLPACPAPTGAPLGAIEEEKAKDIIERVGCPQCHAWVQKKTGPPMKKIQEKYKGDWECVVFRLKQNRTHKEEGVTDDLKGNEFKVVADYIATRAK